MPHDTTLVTTVVAAVVLAFGFGFLAARLKISPIVGFLLAGVTVGPHTPGFVADYFLASQLAEIGVILLMFGIGLHFSFKDLLALPRIALPGAVAQIGVATAIGAAGAVLWGWDVAASLVFGLALSVASTVVLARALSERRLILSRDGRIAISWLLVEDLLMVLALVFLPALVETRSGADAGVATSILLTLGKVAAFLAVAILIGRRTVPWLLARVDATGSRELFTLAVLAIALGIAYGSAALFNVSFALGAFFAGVVLSESALSARAGEETLPLRDAFAVLFFVSVGMLFDPTILIEQPLRVGFVVLVIVFGKSIAAFAIVIAFRYPVRVALTVSASLAQIGEFSFILAGLSVALGVLPDEGRDYVLAGALLSIAFNPLAFRLVDPIAARLGTWPWLKRLARPEVTSERPGP
ncbi:MAG: sodium:proton antiporter [Alphaproteobacteria bacterium]|nr:sodium:proton antiporter [Alphaproteobacteria bacterium]